VTQGSTSDRAAPTRRWALRHWRVRSKVAAVLLVPTVLALVLAGLSVQTQRAERAALQRVAEGTRLTGTVASLVDELQIERSQTTAYVAGNRLGDRTALELTNDRVDRASADLRSAASTVAGLDPGVQDRYAVALARLTGLGPLRTTALASRFPATSVATAYSGLVEPLLALTRDIAGSAGETAIVRPATTLAALGRAKEQAEVQHAILLAGAGAGSLPAGQAEALRSAVAQQDAATAEFEAGATLPQIQLYDDTVAGPDVDQRLRILQTALLRDAANQPLGVVPAAWDTAANVTRADLRQVESGLLESLAATADQSVSSAGRALALAVALVVLGVLLALALALVVARSLVAPLQLLRSAALDVAERRLPESIARIRDTGEGEPDAVEPVAVDTEEEIGELARAFDTVRSEAVRLAGEQARLRANLNTLFVNLSRRSQGLVERQLELIDQLEGQEDDPDVLANLFALDHLATRMRRNGENLLVLGGAVLAHPSSDPVPVADLLRAATGEIEQYQRIVLRPVPGVSLLGDPANDLTHLLAELLDNATSFSAPETSVVVSGSRAPDGGLILEIADDGIGLDAEDLAEANEKLEQPQLLDSSVPRQMGLFVVGALARRHGVVARLLPGNDTGVTASVQIPAGLVVRPVHDRTVLNERAPTIRSAARAGSDDTGPVPVTVPPGAPAPVPEPPDPLTDPLPVQSPSTEDDGSSTFEPIYTEMSSAWFRDHQGEEQPGRSANGSATPPDSTHGDATPGDAPSREWQSAADEGWRAIAARETADEAERTTAGLPKRRRGAALVPGAADSGPDRVPEQVTPDAGALRSRMSRYQDGMRRGRQETGTGRTDPVPAERGDPRGAHD